MGRTSDVPGLDEWTFKIVIVINGAQLRGVITDWGGVLTTPEQAIFLHAAEGLGLEPEQCVFIDDIEANVAAAAACGMTGVHHTDAAQTAAALRDLLGVPLDGAPPSAGASAPSPGNTMR